MARVFVTGMAVADFVFHVDVLPDEARKYRAIRAEVVVGGCAANAAVAIARLGGKAYLGARLGSDHLGGLILANLRREGVNTDFVQLTEGARSSFSSVYVDARGERQIMNFRGSGLAEETTWIANAPDVDAVLVDTRWSAGTAAALALARERRVPGIVDAEPPMELGTFREASHVAFSRDGLLSLVPGKDLPTALKEITAMTNAWVSVTDGGNGAWYSGTTGISHAAAFAVDVKDTLAAGDVWHGAFALALGEGQDEPAAVRFANAAAALKCARFGVREGAPERAVLERFLREGTTCI
ncbi:MAG: PfkB family carbohydrate kinase [Rhodobacteraceae bacterium]|nr:PfkB family carbohydrate kinase [Paracoccaceae bacterium]